MESGKETNEMGTGKTKSNEIDMCHGSLFGKIIVFAVPVMLSGILQLLFNAADIIVVGRFAGSNAMAAVGSTTSLINLFINLFIGLSVGTNVVVAQFYGAGKQTEVSQTVHTAILTSMISGGLLILVGVFLSRPMLVLMDSPENVLNLSVLYLTIYFAGMPATMVYNFGSAILRAVGDTKRPLYYLVVSGVINVILNLVFVIVFGMGVAGVGLATVISESVSAALILRCLMQYDGMIRLDLRKLRITGSKLKRILTIGIPAGMQGVIFAASNVLIQSSVNSFGEIAMAGNTAGANIEGFIYTSMNAFYQTSVSFTSQNFGGKYYNRIGKILGCCLICVTTVGLVLGNGAYLASSYLLRIYSSDAEVIHYGILRMSVISTTYCLCGIMDVFVGSIRGMGRSILPMIVSLAGACGFRVIWIFTVFAAKWTLPCLYISYPISWILTAGVHLLCFILIFHKYKGQQEPDV